MKKLIMLLAIFLLSCSSTETKDKCLDVICDEWKSCLEGACVLNDNRCDTVSDCDNEVCDINHNCVNSENPCEGEVCSNHGNCIVNEGVASCSCDTGFYANGLNCLENSSNSDAIIANHEYINLFTSLPSTSISQIRDNFKIYYGHTSHGSQIITGISMIESENQSFISPHFSEAYGDLGHNGDTTWAQATREFLNNPENSDYNVVMWSWCGGVTDNTEEGINIYLTTMNQLEIDYPNITFIYMTGHTDSYAVENTRARNRQIRDYCTANSKILFDFEDIESYDLSGNYYENIGDDCQWCSDWCSEESCPSCGDCAHSHCLNCYIKGKAFWVMMAKIIGWSKN
ncbi:hypothetical protein JXR93_14440 [bacterium]|nr:hypothetical protein [bacterium]